MSFNFKIDKINKRVIKIYFYEYKNGEKNKEYAHIKLPVDTFEALFSNVLNNYYKNNYYPANRLTEYFEKIENFNLLLNKFKLSDTNEIALWLKYLKDVMFYKQDNSLILNNKYLNYNDFVQQRIEGAKKIISNLPYDLYKTTLKTTHRLVAGLGIASTSEISLTLHHIYGIPYLPGSAVKGVVRSYIIKEYFENSEQRAMANPEFINVFGNEDQQGNIIFFDAFPDADIKLEPDIMNVHYPQYYSGSEPPTDYQNPTPIFFLTIRGNFKFYIAAIRGRIDDYKINEKSIKEWLIEAMENHGIGAKTALGYGRLI